MDQLTGNIKFLLYVALLVLQFVDFATTAYALKHGAHEVNPLLVRLFSKLGVEWGLVVAKAALIGLIAWLYADIPLLAFAAFVAGYSYIAANNVSVIRRARRAQVDSH